ncbi:5-oxoprolinase subunit PxpA [Sediminibacterium soli]|uniref:5-oxoprolinase subunit PxpA n=1 Tax=Sediminibacterium soli TaxID=2698829 RepID=UPI00137B1F26|nr:5-oxoprolinase subunit PxpA [Sediminibacterium soli]NCI45088.1 LamB/YcsF family protein [Sediminibacterium soli]
MNRQTIDINCDMGEGIGNDALLMPYISSANIACGFHAGDNETMLHTCELAIQYQVAIGAHPGFADKANFGRTEMQLPLQEVYDMVSEQVFRLQQIARQLGATLSHVKPHGAMYNMSAKNAALAHCIAKAVKEADASLVLFGLSGSCSISEAAQLGLSTASEVFADRSYQDDGSLTPRSQPGALITTTEQVLQQVLQMVQQHSVTTVNNTTVPIVADTVCIHGDGAHAAAFAKSIFHTLQQHHIDIAKK